MRYVPVQIVEAKKAEHSAVFHLKGEVPECFVRPVHFWVLCEVHEIDPKNPNAKWEDTGIREISGWSVCQDGVDCPEESSNFLGYISGGQDPEILLPERRE